MSTGGDLTVSNNSALGTGTLTVNGAGRLVGGVNVTLPNSVAVTNSATFSINEKTYGGYGMAKVGVEEAVAKLHKKDVRKTVDTGAKLITPDNAKDYFEEVRGKLGGTGRGLDR